MKFNTVEALARHIRDRHETGHTEAAMRAMDEWAAGRDVCPWCDEDDDAGEAPAGKGA